MSLLQFNNSFCSVRGEIRSLFARKCIYIILNALRVRVKSGEIIKKVRGFTCVVYASKKVSQLRLTFLLCSAEAAPCGRNPTIPLQPPGEKGKVPLPLLAQLSPLSLLRSSGQRLLIDNQSFTL